MSLRLGILYRQPKRANADTIAELHGDSSSSSHVVHVCAASATEILYEQIALAHRKPGVNTRDRRVRKFYVARLVPANLKNTAGGGQFHEPLSANADGRYLDSHQKVNQLSQYQNPLKGLRSSITSSVVFEA